MEAGAQEENQTEVGFWEVCDRMSFLSEADTEGWTLQRNDVFGSLSCVLVG